MNSEQFTPTLTLDEYATKARIRMIAHAEKAIEIYEYQLETAKSPTRVAKLKSRIADYQKSLETLRKPNEKEETSGEQK